MTQGAVPISRSSGVSELVPLLHCCPFTPGSQPRQVRERKCKSLSSSSLLLSLLHMQGIGCSWASPKPKALRFWEGSGFVLGDTEGEGQLWG